MFETIKAAMSGKKTNLVGCGFIILGGGLLVGWIEMDQEQVVASLALLSGLLIPAGRAALAKLAPEVAAKLADSATSEPKG